MPSPTFLHHRRGIILYPPRCGFLFCRFHGNVKGQVPQEWTVESYYPILMSPSSRVYKAWIQHWILCVWYCTSMFFAEVLCAFYTSMAVSSHGDVFGYAPKNGQLKATTLFWCPQAAVFTKLGSNIGYCVCDTVHLCSLLKFYVLSIHLWQLVVMVMFLVMRKSDGTCQQSCSPSPSHGHP